MDVTTGSRDHLDALLVQVAAGDEGAFDEFYTHFAPRVQRVTARVLRDETLAEEVTQEVLLEVWQIAERFDPARGSALAWVRTLARRRAVDRVRSVQASRTREERIGRRDDTGPVDDVEDSIVLLAERRRVRTAVADLAARQREAVELAYFRGHSYRDVARILEIPEGTAKSRLRDGLSRLRVSLAEAG